MLDTLKSTNKIQLKQLITNLFYDNSIKFKQALRKDFIVYSVDPERLLIKVSSIMQLEAGSEHTTTYENFLLEKEGVSIHISLEDLPKKIGRFVYFRTRDDAHDFIKTQIGM